jgi:hypothetical protein
MPTATPGHPSSATLDVLVDASVRWHGWALALALLVGALAGTLAAGLPAPWVLFAALAAVLLGSELRARSLARHLATAVQAGLGPDLCLATALVAHPWSPPGSGRAGTLTLAGGIARLELADGRPGGFVARVGDVHLAPWALRHAPVLELGTPSGTLHLAAVGQLDLAAWALPCVPLLTQVVADALGAQRRRINGAPPRPGGPRPDEPRLAP